MVGGAERMVLQSRVGRVLYPRRRPRVGRCAEEEDVVEGAFMMNVIGDEDDAEVGIGDDGEGEDLHPKKYGRSLRFEYENGKGVYTCKRIMSKKCRKCAFLMACITLIIAAFLDWTVF